MPNQAEHTMPWVRTPELTCNSQRQYKGIARAKPRTVAWLGCYAEYKNKHLLMIFVSLLTSPPPVEQPRPITVELLSMAWYVPVIAVPDQPICCCPQAPHATIQGCTGASAAPPIMAQAAKVQYHDDNNHQTGTGVSKFTGAGMRALRRWFARLCGIDASALHG